MSRTYEVSYQVRYSVTTKIEAEDYDDLSAQIADIERGDEIDPFDFNSWPDQVDIDFVSSDAEHSDDDDDLGKSGPFEEDEVDEDEEEEETEEEKVEETK